MFAAPGEAYDRFMGRYSRLLAPGFVAFAGVDAGPVLEVGCGPGALTAELAARIAPTRIAAVDPSESFVAACRARVPGADVRLASAEALPFADAAFGAALSQLVLSFVRDPGRATSELARVVRPRGVVAACTWLSNGIELLRSFWDAARQVDPAAPDEERMAFRTLPELLALWERAGFRDVETCTLEVEARYTDFEDCWEPITYGIGPAGAWLKDQPDDIRAAIREAYRERLGRPAGAFALPARAIAVRGRIGA